MGMDFKRFRRSEGDDWIDWLSDDPVPPSVREKMRQNAVRDASRPASRGNYDYRPNGTPVAPQGQVDAPDAEKKRNVSIHLSIPEIKKPDLAGIRNVVAKWPRKYVVAGCSTLGVVVVFGVAALVISGSSEKGSDKPEVLSGNTAQPTFAYSLPKGDSKSIDAPVKYDSQRKVVNFRDSIGGVGITISQQPLPESFKDDPQNKVKKLAEDFSATEVLSTATPTAFLGTAIEGPQTVIFTKKDLLVFIQSEKKIDNKDWAEYVTNLQ